MKRFNPELLEKIFTVAEEHGEVETITPDFYRMFLEMDDNTIRIISKTFIRALAKDINTETKSGKLKTNTDFCRFITDYWEMMIQGFLTIRESDGNIAFRKPRGVSLNDETEKQIDQKLEQAQPIILKAFREVLDENKNPPEKE